MYLGKLGLTLLDLLGRARSGAKGRETLLGLIVAGLGIHLYYRHRFSFWSKRGIKTPTPLPFLGNLHTVFLRPRQIVELEMPRKYGKVYGQYMGTIPILCVTDIDVVNKICIKDFSIFRDHLGFGIPNRYERNFLFLMKGDEWHRLRSALSPTFSSGRMKVIFKILDKCSEELLEAYQDKLNQAGSRGSVVVDPKELFRLFGVSASLSSFFSMSLDLEGVSDERKDRALASKKELMEKSREIFTVSLFRILVSNIVPKSLLMKFGFTTTSERKYRYFDGTTQAIIESRKRSGKKYNDYLQILLDIEDEEPEIKAASDSSEAHHGASEEKASVETGKFKLNSEQLACQVIIFLMVAGETIGHVVSSALFILSHHQDMQERLYRELSKIKLNDSKNGETFNYDQLSSCTYLDCIVSETMRLMGPVLVSDRVASEDYTIEKYNLTIPKGTGIMISNFAIMRDPDYWHEPDSFIPERFLPENRSDIVAGSYCPFGLGPRFCLAFRFALTATKISLARLVLEYKFSPAPGAKYPPEYKWVFSGFNAFKDISVSVAKR